MSKTFVKILAFTSALILVVMLVFSLASFRGFENIMRDTTYDKNLNDLKLISEGIGTMHQSAQQFAYNLIEDHSMDALFRKGSMKDISGYEAMMDLSDSLAMNPQYHSAILYSGFTGEFFSTRSSKAQLDGYFIDCIENSAQIPALLPVSRQLPAEAYYGSSAVFTYYYYQTDSKNNVVKAIAVNMNAMWVSDHLSALKGNSSKAYIIDNRQHTFIDDTGGIYGVDDTDKDLIRRITETGESTGNFELQRDDGEFLVTYLWMGNPDWILVVEEPNTYIRESIAIILNTLIPIIIAVLVLALAGSYIISRSLYRPFGKLYRQIAGGKLRGAKPKLVDDIAFIQDIIELSQEQLNEYITYKSSASDILFETYIRAILREDEYAKGELSKQSLEQYERMLQSPMTLTLLRVDRLAPSQDQDNAGEDFYGYSMMKTSEKLFGTQAARLVHIGERKYVLILFGPSAPVDAEGWEKMARVFQMELAAGTGLTASAFWGGCATGPKGLVSAYQIGSELMNHAVLYGRQCAPHSEMLAARPDTEYAYSEALERDIFNVLRSGQADEARQLFENFLGESAQGNLSDFMLNLTRLFLALDKKMETANKNRIHKIPVSVKELYYSLSKYESLDDIRDGFDVLAGNIGESTGVHETRHETLVTAVMVYVENHYTSEISLKGIAAEFKMSAGYLGTIFKENTGMSVWEYIGRIRLQKAEELVVGTNLSMGEIMQRTGFSSESNFYKAFKQQYGETPKSYRLKKGLPL